MLYVRALLTTECTEEGEEEMVDMEGEEVEGAEEEEEEEVEDEGEERTPEYVS